MHRPEWYSQASDNRSLPDMAQLLHENNNYSSDVLSTKKVLSYVKCLREAESNWKGKSSVYDTCVLLLIRSVLAEYAGKLSYETTN